MQNQWTVKLSQIKQTTHLEMIITWKIISDFSAKTLPSMYGWLMSPSLADHLIIFTQNQFQSIEYQKCTFSPGSLAANGSWIYRPYNSVWFDGAVSANWPASDDHQRFCDLQTKGEECWTTIEHPRSLIRSTSLSIINHKPPFHFLPLSWTISCVPEKCISWQIGGRREPPLLFVSVVCRHWTELQQQYGN